MSGGGALTVYVLAVVCCLTFVGARLLFAPVKTTRAMNEAFVVIPKADGHHALLKQALTMAIGATLLCYAGYLINGIFHLAHAM